MQIRNRVVFVAKSMLWSLLLYALFMLAFNWDDVSNRVRGTDPITVVNSTSPSLPSASKGEQPASISLWGNMFNLVMAIANAVAYTNQ